jgi:L-ascorbate metabolism protein UlaG (beta-lactamase superfamily)
LQIHINPGPGSLVRYRQCDLSARETDVILVSRNTTLHANDVNAVIDAMTNDGLDKKGVLVSIPQAIEGDSKRRGLLEQNSQNNIERVIQLKVGDKVALNNVEISPTPTEYSDESGVGYLISTPKYLLSYVGDTKYAKRVSKPHEIADIVILNVPFIHPKSDEPGMSLEDAIKFIHEVKPILAIVTGFGMKMLESDILDHIRRIQHETKVQTIAAKDGMIINPLSYTSVITQRKLFANRSDAL